MLSGATCSHVFARVAVAKDRFNHLAKSCYFSVQTITKPVSGMFVRKRRTNVDVLDFPYVGLFFSLFASTIRVRKILDTLRNEIKNDWWPLYENSMSSVYITICLCRTRCFSFARAMYIDSSEKKKE